MAVKFFFSDMPFNFLKTAREVKWPPETNMLVVASKRKWVCFFGCQNFSCGCDGRREGTRERNVIHARRRRCWLGHWSILERDWLSSKTLVQQFWTRCADTVLVAISERRTGVFDSRRLTLIIRVLGSKFGTGSRSPRKNTRIIYGWWVYGLHRQFGLKDPWDFYLETKITCLV